MERKDETMLIASLTEAIGDWLVGAADDLASLPFIGDNLCEIMARAALAPLLAVADTNATRIKEEQVMAENVANARLFAAAPDLLEACEAAHSVLLARYGHADAEYVPEALAAMAVLAVG